MKGIESQLGLSQPWTPDSPQYMETVVLMTNAKYLKVVDKLECLVVQWLFELTKLNLSGTGMY